MRVDYFASRYSNLELAEMIQQRAQQLGQVVDLSGMGRCKLAATLESFNSRKENKHHGARETN